MAVRLEAITLLALEGSTDAASHRMPPPLVRRPDPRFVAGRAEEKSSLGSRVRGWWRGWVKPSRGGIPRDTVPRGASRQGALRTWQGREGLVGTGGKTKVEAQGGFLRFDSSSCHEHAYTYALPARLGWRGGVWARGAWLEGTGWNEPSLSHSPSLPRG